MSNYSDMSLQDLEELKGRLLNQRSKLDNTIDDVIASIIDKQNQLDETTIKLNPYYKGDNSIIRISIGDTSYKYIVTRIIPNGVSAGITHLRVKEIDFVKYYKICSEVDWNNAISQLNNWLKDNKLKVSTIDE